MVVSTPLLGLPVSPVHRVVLTHTQQHMKPFVLIHIFKHKVCRLVQQDTTRCDSFRRQKIFPEDFNLLMHYTTIVTMSEKATLCSKQS